MKIVRRYFRKEDVFEATYMRTHLLRDNVIRWETMVIEEELESNMKETILTQIEVFIKDHENRL